MYWPSVHGHADMVNLLLKAGTDPNRKSHHFYRDTPLHRAARNGHKYVVQLLLEGGADPNIANNKFETPLHAAALNGSGSRSMVRVPLGL